MTKRICKKPLALILTVLMVMGLFPPVTVSAEESSITAYVTVSVEGTIATGTGDTTIAQIPVEVSDKNDIDGFDIDDALHALHETYYVGGAGDGYSSEDNNITKLWGKTGDHLACFVDNVSADSLADPISSGDHITAFVNTNSTTYAKFDSFTKEVAVGESVSLTLQTTDGNSAWSSLSDALVKNLLNSDVTLATTDASGEATISFPKVGTYYITASHETETIVPPICKIEVTEPTNYATVRIEGNGFGIKGTDSNIATVLESTMVNLDTLSSEHTAINVVNAALDTIPLDKAVKSTLSYTTFGGVSGTDEQDWHFMLNDELASAGLDTQEILPGNDIVLMLSSTDEDTNYPTFGYAYFKTISSSSKIQYDYPYGEVTLRLYSKQNGTDTSNNPTWSVTPVTNTQIYTNGDESWTPDSLPGITDAENGISSITLWGGTNAGTYYFDISATVNGHTSAYCRATMVYDGVNAPTLSFSAPSAKDTTLSKLDLNFSDIGTSNGLPYLRTNGMDVGNAVDSVNLTATPSDSNATITATYQDADDPTASDCNLDESIALATGDNTFKFIVTNGEDTQTHTLVITKKDNTTRHIPNEVSSLINGLKTIGDDAPTTNWVLAMHAAGLSLTDEQLETYLGSTLATINDFVDNKKGYPASMAKIAIALTSLGIDARQIPDPDGGEAIDLVTAVAGAYTVVGDSYLVYNAPFVFSLYDLGNYEIPDNALHTRLELINAILDILKGDWSEGSYDGVGMVLPALAPYYNATAPVNGIDADTCSKITIAINNKLTAMSDAQAIDGGFGAPNANTVATVMTGLNAIGVDANSDTRFSKGGTSLLMNLLSFRTSDDKLGYTDATSANTYASLQGFQALATWDNLFNARSSNLYHFTQEIAPYTNWPDAKLLTSIAVTTKPTDTTYALGGKSEHLKTNGMVITATYNADATNTEEIDLSKCSVYTIDSNNSPVDTIDCSASGTKTVKVTYQGQTATFLVTVLAANNTKPDKDTVSVKVRSNNGEIARNSSLVIEKNVTSALDVLKTVLDDAGKTYVVRNETYVAEIDNLGEFDKGENSGWLYSVNGVTPPTTPSHNFTLSDGDVVVWYYTLDYKKDSSSSKWSHSSSADHIAPSVTVSNGVAPTSVSKTNMTSAIATVKKNNSSVITIEPKIKGTANTVSVDIPKSSLSDVASQTSADLTVKTPIGNVTIPNETLNSIHSQAEDSTVTVTLDTVDNASLTTVQKEKVGENTVFDISILSGSDHITEFDNENISISLPYELKSDEDASGVTVWYLDNSGALQQMTATYDTKTGLATFSTPHLSYYVVGYTTEWTHTFSDIKSADWFYNAVKYAVRKELFNGTSDTSFAPNDNMTRAMLVTVLFRLEGTPSITAASSFTDVETNQWYTDAVAWASTNEIVSGYGDGRFGTNDNITREQIATILYRYTQYKGDDVTKTADLNEYTDASNISTWAQDAMKWTNAEELITGTSSTTLSPLDSTTRAQVATILMRLLKN